jgi:hypothetical protein
MVKAGVIQAGVIQRAAAAVRAILSSPCGK